MKMQMGKRVTLGNDGERQRLVRFQVAWLARLIKEILSSMPYDNCLHLPFNLPPTQTAGRDVHPGI